MPAAQVHLQIFSRLFGQSTAPTFIRWSAFMHAMHAAGYRVQHGRGLKRRFIPPASFGRNKISICQPKRGLLDRSSQKHIARLLQAQHGVDLTAVRRLLRPA
ncbi:hypothetical protein C8Q76DRAFT_802434 [Earliella scabrosa]|nr:hypothetical protein C8Q76DRAFT_802433 [Earliella scabrosa]KAI0702150.1 hypothetical protein C8Q76DRAFT_802434 [Earliella scabrosa]